MQQEQYSEIGTDNFLALFSLFLPNIQVQSRQASLPRTGLCQSSLLAFIFPNTYILEAQIPRRSDPIPGKLGRTGFSLCQST